MKTFINNIYWYSTKNILYSYLIASKKLGSFNIFTICSIIVNFWKNNISSRYKFCIYVLFIFIYLNIVIKLLSWYIQDIDVGLPLKGGF